MNLELVKNSYRRALTDKVIFRRYSTKNSSKFDTGFISANIGGYKPEQLVGNIKQGDKRVVALAEELIMNNFIPTINDKVVVNGKEYQILSVDGETRSHKGTTVAYDLNVRG